MKSYIAAFASFYLLNFILNIANIWENGPSNVLFLAPELIIILIAFSIFPFVNNAFSKLALYLVSLALLFVSIFKICDFVVPNFFSRPFNLYIDSSYFPDLLHFLYHSLPIWKFTFYFSLLVITAISSIFIINYCLKKSIHVANKHYTVFGMAMLILFVLDATVNIYIFHPISTKRIIQEINFVDDMRDYQELYSLKLNEAKKEAAKHCHDLGKLEKSNVLLFFVESYGATVFEKEEHFDLITPTIDDFSRTLANNNYTIASSYLTSPTFGGNSWLAHGSFSCGVKTFNQIIFEMLLTSEVKPLATYFVENGYEAISVMPGTTKPWPEGTFFGFNKKYFSWHFDYKGPMYGWAPMTDQYVIDYIHNNEVKTQTKPLFIEYVLISSHAPFHIQPPYIANWQEIQDGQLYNNKEAITFPIVWPDLSNATKGYVHSISYVLKTLEYYLENNIQDNTLVIILGDHQPHGVITGSNQLWNVPIHVISRNKKLIDPFYERGYSNSFVPLKSNTYKGMETFLYDFLEDFSKK